MTDLLDHPRSGGRPSIDPRIARRWIDARREEGRRRLRLLAVALTLVVVAGLLLGSLYTPLFSVRHVHVQVDGAVAPASVQALAGLDHHLVMMDVHSAAIAARLDGDPWLGGARVSRAWPSTVTVTVSVRTPVAAVAAAGGRWAQVDRTGRVLTVTSSPPAGLPQLLGITAPAPGAWLPGSPGPSVAPLAPVGSFTDMRAQDAAADVPAGIDAALALLTALPAGVRAGVQSVHLGTPLSLVVTGPAPGSRAVAVDLGDGSLLQAKVVALATLLGQTPLAGVTSIDLTVPSRPATIAAAS